MKRDGHIRVLPIHVANKIAAGEVVERPASVVKELVENAIDAGAKTIRIAISQGGRKLVSVQDDGCGMNRDDAVLSLERQATSKILDVEDIEQIETLGFRGEAIPSIASVSRFSITTRRHDAEEGTRVEVNAGALADVRAAGCPPGTLVEVRDLFCNVPARRKFMRTAATEEAHVRNIFTVNALAHPGIAFSLVVDGHEAYRLAAAKSPYDRIRELFGREFAECLLPVESIGEKASVTGYIEQPNRQFPTRREQFIFVNGRPATAPSIAYALREAYPRRDGDPKPAAVLFISVPPRDVDVNVHPTKHEVRFRDNLAVRQAIMDSLQSAVGGRDDLLHVRREQTAESGRDEPLLVRREQTADSGRDELLLVHREQTAVGGEKLIADSSQLTVGGGKVSCQLRTSGSSSLPSDNFKLQTENCKLPIEQPLPLAVPAGDRAQPWTWFRFLAVMEPGYVLLETDSGIVTLNPKAAMERIAFERLTARSGVAPQSQPLLLPDTVTLPPAAAHRISSSLDAIRSMGFHIEQFGQGTFKIDAIPQLIGDIPPADILATIADALAQPSASAKSGEKWRDDIIAKTIARTYAGASVTLDERSATDLVHQLVSCRMPYVTPNGKSVMIFTSTRELDRKFGKT